MRTKSKLRRYTAAEDQIILNYVKSSGVAVGCRIAAKQLNRSEKAVNQRYYYILNNNIKVTSAPATIRVVKDQTKNDLVPDTKNVEGELQTMKLNIKGVEITMVFK